MRQDSHITRYKQHLATQYLGTRHVLHIKHEGGISHNPSEVNVSRTVKRHSKRIELAKKAAESVAKPNVVKLGSKK